MNFQYSMVIRWSPEDNAYLVHVPEFVGEQRFLTHGATYEEAARMGQDAIATLIAAYQTAGKPLPVPNAIDLDQELNIHSQPSEAA